MNNYRYLNLNPDGLDTQDCTIRAISLFLDISWDDAYWGVVTEGFLQKKMPSTDTVWGRYLEKNNCYLTRVPSDCPLCYTVKDFANDFNKGRYLLKVNEHVVTVINGAQNMLQQQNITMEQFMQSPQQYVQQIVPQDRLQWAMQQANAIYGRK